MMGQIGTKVVRSNCFTTMISKYNDKLRPECAQSQEEKKKEETEKKKEKGIEEEVEGRTWKLKKNEGKLLERLETQTLPLNRHPRRELN